MDRSSAFVLRLGPDASAGLLVRLVDESKDGHFIAGIENAVLSRPLRIVTRVRQNVLETMPLRAATRVPQSGRRFEVVPTDLAKELGNDGLSVGGPCGSLYAAV